MLRKPSIPIFLLVGCCLFLTLRSASPNDLENGLTQDSLQLMQPPEVTAVSPPDQDMGVSLEMPVSVTFDMDMDGESIHSSSFFLTPTVKGIVTFDAGTRTATFTPSPALRHNTLYTATLLPEIQTQQGVGLADTYTWTFTTEDIEMVEEDPEDDGLSLLFSNNGAQGSCFLQTTTTAVGHP